MTGRGTHGARTPTTRPTPPVRRWKDLSSDEKKRRMAWVRGTDTLDGAGPSIRLVDPEVRRLTDEIKARVRAQRAAEGRL